MVEEKNTSSHLIKLQSLQKCDNWIGLQNVRLPEIIVFQSIHVWTAISETDTKPDNPLETLKCNSTSQDYNYNTPKDFFLSANTYSKTCRERQLPLETTCPERPHSW